MNKIYDYGKIIFIIAIFSCQLEWTTEAHYIQWEYHEIPRPPKKLVPSEIMVDITNDLSYRILHYHSISNRNNIAFSPTALTSVLIALYEGSNGRSAFEVKHILGLPSNRDITRIGYRDIHRRLRTYFFAQENPLIGLSLNKENVTITPEYEAILKFYGYDLGIDMVSSAPSTADVTPLSEKTTEIPDCSTEMKSEETTLIPEKLNELDTETTTEKITTTETPLPITTTPAAATTTTTTKTTTEVSTMPPLTTTSTIPPTTTTTMVPTTTTDEPITESTTEAIQKTTMYIRTFKPVQTQSDRLRDSPAITVDNTLLPVGRRTNRVVNQIQMPMVSLPSGVRQSRSRSKRHFFNSIDYNSGFHPGISSRNSDIDTDVYVAFVPGPQIQSPTIEPPLAFIPQEFNIYNDQVGIGGIPLDQSYIVPKEISSNNIINHIFYINPQETIHSTFKIYNSLLNYNYLESLKISILELELDAEEYNLLILLPDFNIDIDSAIASLKLAPSLRLLRKQLRPRWVQAMIPDFQMKGNIYLTNDLQNMGINDIFEPLRADFTPMSNESNIYVKHIEQSINVHIRTRSVDQIKRNIAQQYRPIEVAVNHPFIFFIVDKELDVALMAGKVLNPLNVRIQ